MAYRLSADEAVREGIRRCAREQLDHAVTELSERIDDAPSDAVHDARKAIKRERSLLRLVRGAMPRAERRRENQALRDAARGLSDARDAEASIETLDALSQRYAGQLPEPTFRTVREALETTRARPTGSLSAARAARELEEIRQRLEHWTLTSGGWDALEAGLDRSYRRGRTASVYAQSHRANEDWHAWRKRVKDLWYQERLVAKIGGPAVSGHAKDAHQLADLLGDDHDLGVLRALLEKRAPQIATDVEAVIGLIDFRRGELRGQALAVGARVYAEAPKAYLRRMKRVWKAGRAGARTAVNQDPSELAELARGLHAA